MANVRVYPDANALARAAVEALVLLIDEVLTEQDRFALALSGGSTPRAMYELMATPNFADHVDWACLHIFWGDERCVPSNHDDSNYRMAREVLLAHVPIPEENVHRIQGELAPETAATAYAQELRAFFGPQRPRFDLILLGMGSDGHTASLFPDTPALNECERDVVANYVSKFKSWRITLTFPVLNASRKVYFWVRGAAKAAALARVWSGAPLPAAQVDPVAGEVVWFVDADAIHQLA